MNEIDSLLSSLHIQVNLLALFLLVIILFATGRMMKKFPWFQNVYIPFALACLGAILWPLFLKAPIQPDAQIEDRVLNAAFGFAIGWMSTGLYEFLRQVPILNRLLSLSDSEPTTNKEPDEHKTETK